MKVIATERGVYGKLIEAGEVFEFDAEDGKRDVKRDADGRPVLDENGAQIPDPNGEKLLPSWVVEATDENVEKYAREPLSHPKLDDEGRPYPYSVPYAKPGEVTAPMEDVAAAVNEVQAEFEATTTADEQRVIDAEAAQARAEGEGVEVERTDEAEAKRIEDEQAVAEAKKTESEAKDSEGRSYSYAEPGDEVETVPARKSSRKPKGEK